jgi:long-chain acyl-CoA synthetase
MNSHIDFLKDRFRLADGQEAIIWKEQIYSYSWLHDQILYWQKELCNSGVKCGDVVLLEADFSPNSMALFLALAEIGAVLVPLTESIAHKKKEFAKISQGEVQIQIDSDDRVTFNRLDQIADHPLYAELRSRKKPGLVLFSSGSTGKSKATVHDLSCILQKFRTKRPSRRTISFLLYDHIGGVNTMLHTLSNQACIVTVQDRDPDHVMKIVSQYNVQVLPASPTFLNLILISEAWKNYDLTLLELVTYGTESMPENTLLRFNHAFPHVKLLQTYGLSELGILRSKSKSNNSLWFKIGGEGFETRIVDGLLEIKAQSAMLGYLNAPSPLTADGWFQTEDEVEIDGDWIKILGRKSEIINVGGEKVYPAEVEGILQEMKGVVDASVYGEKNIITGMIVVAIIHLTTNETCSEFRIRMKENCLGRLLPFQIPVKVTITEKTLHGKRFKKMRKIK